MKIYLKTSRILFLMSPSNAVNLNHGLDPQPCPDCPYPMNILVVPLSQKDGIEHFSVTCRECGDSWSETIGDEE